MNAALLHTRHQYFSATLSFLIFIGIARAYGVSQKRMGGVIIYSEKTEHAWVKFFVIKYWTYLSSSKIH